MSKYFIILPPPCTNADLHMGHLAGVYMPADVYARYLTLSNNEVVSIGGADQKNTYTAKKAHLLHQSLEFTQEFFAEKILKSFQDAYINCSSYIKTNSKSHINMAREILFKLTANGLVEDKNMVQFYCEFCKEYASDNEMRGLCAHCFNESDGGICENCNSPIFNSKLINPVHARCSLPLIPKMAMLKVFNLDKLKNKLLQTLVNLNWDDRLKNKYLEYLTREFTDAIPMSNHFKFGIEFIHKTESKYLAIWFEAVWSFFTGLAEHYHTDLDGVIKLLNNEQTFVIPFMGQDTEFYYVLGLSAVMLGLGIERLPWQFSIQRFIKLDSQKFSSSRNHMISIQKLLPKYSADLIRYYSLTTLKSYWLNENDFRLYELDKIYKKFNSLEEILCNHAWHWCKCDDRATIDVTTLNIFNQFQDAMQNLKFDTVTHCIEKMIAIIHKNHQKRPLNVEIACWLMMLKPIMPEWADTIGQALFSHIWFSINYNSVLQQVFKFNPPALLTKATC